MSITTDILLYESGDGGEFSIQSGDLALTESLFNQVYLALFGGNVASNTKREYLPTEERFDYWANSLIWVNEPIKQFNSNTERVLQEVALNSSGRLAILQAVNDDLQYLNSLLDFAAESEIISVNKIRIIVNFTAKGNQQDRVLQLVYDNAKNEIIIEQTI